MNANDLMAMGVSTHQGLFKIPAGLNYVTVEERSLVSQSFAPKLA